MRLQYLEGGTLALFRYADLEYCLISIIMVENQTPVYVKVKDFSELRSKMMDEIFCSWCESFWKGFDAKDIVCPVIITRLPFENPGHPVMETRKD